MKKHYKQLTVKEREQIDVLKRQGHTVKTIALIVGYHKSTISRELNRNASPEYGCYLSGRAQTRSEVRKRAANTHERLKDPRIVAYVREKITQEQWSPEIIAGRISIDVHGVHISHEAIYQYIYSLQMSDRKELVAHLARGHRMRKRKTAGRKPRKTKIPNRVPIDERPSIVENRTQFGHWETDSIVSRKSSPALNSLTERRSRLLLLSKIPKKGAVQTADTIIAKLQRFPSKWRRTLTLDNGTEHVEHKRITDTVGTSCYFAHPYSSYERGSNEQINGLVRHYLPKGTDFSKIPHTLVTLIQDKINRRPRKCLNFKAPSEVASNSVVALQH